MNSEELTFSEKRKEWLSILSSKEDFHAIDQQLINLTWDITCFEIINKARSLAPKDDEKRIMLNGLVHSLIDRGFLNLVATRIRCLMDKKYENPQKGVNSLVALIDDMRTHQELFNREAIFNAENLFFNYEPIEKEISDLSAKSYMSGGNYSDSRDIKVFLSKKRHHQIDKLTGISPQSRSPKDTVNPAIFDKLREKVEPCKTFCIYVDKFIAHAATPESRLEKNAEEIEITLESLSLAHRCLCEVANFISTVLLGSGTFSYLGVPQYDQFKYIDHSLVNFSQISELGELWDTLEKKYEKWTQWSLDNYIQEFSV